jgi:hypothetical protein
MKAESHRFRTRLTVGVAMILITLLLDPYTFGDAGGEIGLTYRSWQSVAAAVQAAALVAVAACAWLSGFRRALALASVEFSSCVALNVLYLIRDGTARFDSGYSGDTTVVVAVGVGFALRASHVVLLHRLTSIRATMS